jgi:hypothetical protein
VAIYEKDKRAVTTGEAMLEHMGYSTKEGKSGTAGRALSAMRQYGLIEDVSGNYRISESGLHIVILPENDPRRLALIQQAAIRPPLFEKVLTFFSFDLPSDTTLRSHVILEEGFNPDSANTFIRNLRRTKEFANLSAADYNGSSESENVVEGELVGVESMPLQNTSQPSTVPNMVYGSAVISGNSPDHVFSYQLSFPRNIRAEVRIFGTDLRKQDIERLMKEVGDLAGAFDEEPSEQIAVVPVEPTQ